MKAVDVVATAFRNAFRSRLRTSLTVLAIFIGAFTLSLTNGLGTGVNRYLDDTVASVGVDDVMTVTKASEDAPTDGPAEYDPDQVEVDGPPGATAVALTDADLETIADVDGVRSVEPVKTVSTDYVRYDDGPRYQLSVSQFVPGMKTELAAGTQVDLDADEPQLVLPESHLEPLGLGSASDAVGQTVVLAVTDATGTQETTRATVVGVAEPGVLTSVAGAVPNDVLTETLYDLQTAGEPASAADRYAQASVWFDPTAGAAATTALQDRLADAGFTASTLEDQLGTLTAVIDAIVLVLNGFAVIALVAAGIGIVNTLFMAVQERTREVGLMKAMGLSSARVFSLFSIEAVVIGLVGSALGVLGAFGVGALVNGVSGGLLADLPGLTLIAFDPVTVATVVLSVLAIAFVAGTLPALRASRQDPISSLRYE